MTCRYDKHMHTLDHVRRCLESHKPEQYPQDGSLREAAVAIVVKENASDSDILFIKRATVPGDPWSGQMAFPGGHRDPEDTSLEIAAIRETSEEVGVDLTLDQCMGRLTHQRPASNSRGNQLVVVPFVFGISDLPEIETSHEVESVVWGSLSEMMKGTTHATERLSFGGSSAVFNGYRLGNEQFVWGLTYRTLQTFFEVINPVYQIPEDPSVSPSS